MHKIWHKPLHKRKAWKQMSLLCKSVYYVKPFVGHLLDTWLQPLPFPTLLKFVHSCIFIVFVLLPVIYPIIILICYYAIIQHLLESDLNIRYPHTLDLNHYVEWLFKYQIENDQYASYVNLYLEKWRYVATAIASCIDYMRIAFQLIMD